MEGWGGADDFVLLGLMPASPSSDPVLHTYARSTPNLRTLLFSALILLNGLLSLH